MNARRNQATTNASTWTPSTVERGSVHFPFFFLLSLSFLLLFALRLPWRGRGLHSA